FLGVVFFFFFIFVFLLCFFINSRCFFKNKRRGGVKNYGQKIKIKKMNIFLVFFFLARTQWGCGGG
ncbi:hypothetical protein, partial [Enterobacter intestinihominis]